LDFNALFERATDGRAIPYGYQRRLAEAAEWPMTLEIPTGLGKTEAIVLGWLARRMREPEREPRRLVYVLPMRALVEQTAMRTRAMLEALHARELTDLPTVEVVMGGDVGSDWIAEPTRPSILIGTQDMLLSRALNRGYAMSRFKWPMAFAWLHSDALWVLDEVQLQGVGVTTAAQLQGLRDALGTYGTTRTVFASATLDLDWIATVDHPVTGTTSRMQLNEDDRNDPRIAKIIGASKIASRLTAYAETDIAKVALERHRAGTRTLVIANTVGRATAIYRAIRKERPALDCTLLHSRFRVNDREEHLRSALADAAADGDGKIVVATQVVEAGIDFSAAMLISDLAPWSSIVQRLGRCNRRGDDADAQFLWADPPELKPGTALPYTVEELAVARRALLECEGKSLAPDALPDVKMLNELGAMLRRVDLFELFDTASDLSGNDVDVSRFIRDADDFSVQLLWRDHSPTEKNPPRREELCPAAKSEVESLLRKLRDDKDFAARVRTNRVAATDPWTAVPEPGRIHVGDVIWFASDLGRYSAEFGFDPKSTDRVAPIAERFKPLKVSDLENPTIDRDERCFLGTEVALAQHADDAAQQALLLGNELVAASLLETRLVDRLVIAARWHDAGKAHPVFQQTMIKAGAGAEGGPWAKSPRHRSARHERPNFRHELASALAWLDVHDGEPDADLVAYLILAHHGIIRISAQALPGELGTSPRTICGIRDGEPIPGASLGDATTFAAFQAHLELFDVGSRDGRPTWAERVDGLCRNREIGPFRLAYLESLLRIADWRASASPGAINEESLQDEPSESAS